MLRGCGHANEPQLSLAEEVYNHYYRYYRQRTAKIDVKLVLVTLVLVISLFQVSAFNSATLGTSQSVLTLGTSQSVLTLGTSLSVLTLGTSQSVLTLGTSQNVLTLGTSQSVLIGARFISGIVCGWPYWMTEVMVTIVQLYLLVQYIGWSGSHSNAIAYALNNPAYHARARQFAESKGLLKELSSMRVGKDISRSDYKDHERQILRKVLEENLNIT